MAVEIVPLETERELVCPEGPHFDWQRLNEKCYLTGRSQAEMGYIPLAFKDSTSREQQDGWAPPESEDSDEPVCCDETESVVLPNRLLLSVIEGEIDDISHAIGINSHLYMWRGACCRGQKQHASSEVKIDENSDSVEIGIELA